MLMSIATLLRNTLGSAERSSGAS